jgi:hypothetical protein
MPPRKRATPRKSTQKKSATRSELPDGAARLAVAGRPELIVVADPAAALRVSSDGISSPGRADVRSLTRIAGRSGRTLTPLFGPEERVLRAAEVLRPMAEGPVPDLSVYYRLEAPDDQLEELAEELAGVEGVQGAYVKPAVESPVMGVESPMSTEAPAVTPDFSTRQGYLDPAPGGVDARYAWTWPGGGGAGVRIIDCEHNWHFDHEDLTANQGGMVVGTSTANQDHGTAVLGEISGDRNTIGITGICPDAVVSGASWSTGSSAAAIRGAADRLGAGDIILLEGHRPGPRHNFTLRDDQLGYIALEWWPDDFDAIRYAITRGIIVVEAAGNGAEDLDDALYSTRPAGFPVTWTNPFNRSNRDSGAIVVGAGAPPPGTHGLSWGADRSRLGFSNWGALVDAQGWGSGVTSTGYGDLQGGSDERLWYTDTFGGTSSASPIVVGVLGCLQGALAGTSKPLMTPATARAWLRATGSPQQDEPGRPATQRIGNRPDLKALIMAHVKSGFLLDKNPIHEGKGLFKELKNEKRETKELKFETKEHKIEFKDFKNEKAEIKEVKEKVEYLEHKPPILENQKDIFEGDLKGNVEGKGVGNEGDLGIDVLDRIRRFGGRGAGVGGIGVGGPAAWGTPQSGLDPTGLDQRLARIEQTVASLVHFIGADLRPDLGSGALGREADVQAQARDAKQYKDLKDKENLADG